MSKAGRRVAIITGSRGIGAGLVAGYRRRGWAVVATARTIKPSQDPDVLTVSGDIADPVTADRIIDAALGQFGRVDTLVNNAGVFISKPFTDYTAEDYALVTSVNLAGSFWPTQRVMADMAQRYGSHVVNVSATLAKVANSGSPSVLTSPPPSSSRWTTPSSPSTPTTPPSPPRSSKPKAWTDRAAAENRTQQ